MTSACLAITGNRENRQTAGTPLNNTVFMPYCTGPSSIPNSLDYFESLLRDPNSGLDLPAAVILETIQAEGGIYVAEIEWLKRLRKLCDEYKMLLIVDDIQVGCGRSGTFFSFERAGIAPDIVCLAKSISGYGLPMAINLIKPGIDVWKPGQHTGTFRGNQLAFLAASGALDLWKTPDFQEEIHKKGLFISDYLTKRLKSIDARIELRGLGLLLGVDLSHVGGEAFAKKVSQSCFSAGLIIEKCGRDDVVLKVMPPLITSEEILEKGCDILCTAIQEEFK